MIRTLLLTSLLSLAAIPSPLLAGDCGCGSPSYSSSCNTCQGRCRHHCCHRHWCEPPPQGMVVASYPAFPVAAFPVQNFVSPANFTFQAPAAPRLDDATLQNLKRMVDAELARAPVSCNGSKSASPLSAPAIPAEGAEARLDRLERDVDQLTKNMEKLLNMVEKKK